MNTNYNSRLSQIADDLKISQARGYVGVYDNNSNIVQLSNAYIKILNCSYEELRGISITEYQYPNNKNAMNFVKDSANYLVSSKKNTEDIFFYDDMVLRCQNKIIQEHKSVIGHMVNIFPVRSDDNINVSLLNILRKRYGGNGFTKHLYLDGIELKDIERMVVLGLLLSYNLSEIANLLGKSRSYISKIITDSLCKKFGVCGYSSRFLLDKLVYLGYYAYIPESFLFCVQNKDLIQSNPISPKFMLTNPRHNTIIEMLVSKYTHQEIADTLGCSRTRVTDIISNQIQKQLQHQINMSFDTTKDFIKYLKSSHHNQIIIN